MTVLNVTNGIVSCCVYFTTMFKNPNKKEQPSGREDKGIIEVDTSLTTWTLEPRKISHTGRTWATDK